VRKERLGTSIHSKLVGGVKVRPHLRWLVGYGVAALVLGVVHLLAGGALPAFILSYRLPATVLALGLFGLWICSPTFGWIRKATFLVLLVFCGIAAFSKPRPYATDSGLRSTTLESVGRFGTPISFTWHHNLSASWWQRILVGEVPLWVEPGDVVAIEARELSTPVSTEWARLVETTGKYGWHQQPFYYRGNRTVASMKDHLRGELVNQDPKASLYALQGAVYAGAPMDLPGHAGPHELRDQCIVEVTRPGYFYVCPNVLRARWPEWYVTGKGELDVTIYARDQSIEPPAAVLRTYVSAMDEEARREVETAHPEGVRR